MSIIKDFIEYRLNTGLNKSVIISGMDKSGKSYLVRQLISDNPKYELYRYRYELERFMGIPWKVFRYYNIFERCPLLEHYVYDDLYSFGDSMTVSRASRLVASSTELSELLKYKLINWKSIDRAPKYSVDKDSEEFKNAILLIEKYHKEYELIKDYIQYFNDPLFVVYTHNLWDTNDEPAYVYDSRELIRDRYLDIVSILKRLGYPIVVCTENKIVQYNILYNNVSSNNDSYTTEDGQLIKISNRYQYYKYWNLETER